MATDGPVLVGVDGSEQSTAALSWAVGAAELRNTDVHVVVINDHPWRDNAAREVVDGITERCRSTHPATRISERVIQGRPAAELIRLSSRAQLVVVGARGRGGVAGTMWGSVSTMIATHSHCPVVVVPTYRTNGPVFVGVDRSPHGQSVLEFAFTAAATRHTPLTALQTWEVAAAEHSVVLAPPEVLREARSGAERSLGEQLTGWGERYPNVTLRRSTPRGHPVAALSEQAHNAQLLVVGHGRKRGRFAHLRRRSVARRVLHRAQCPVAVIPPDSTSRATHDG